MRHIFLARSAGTPPRDRCCRGTCQRRTLCSAPRSDRQSIFGRPRCPCFWQSSTRPGRSGSGAALALSRSGFRGTAGMLQPGRLRDSGDAPDCKAGKKPSRCWAARIRRGSLRTFFRCSRRRARRTFRRRTLGRRRMTIHGDWC